MTTGTFITHGEVVIHPGDVTVGGGFVYKLPAAGKGYIDHFKIDALLWARKEVNKALKKARKKTVVLRKDAE